MKTALLFLGSIALIACASGGKTKAPCENSIARMLPSGEPVYNRCAVDTPAEFPRTGTGPRYTPSQPFKTCYMADVELVVDATGRPDMQSARVLRQNDGPYLDAIMSWLPGLRYAPAKKDGQAVAQLVQYNGRMMLRVGGAVGPTPSCT